MNTSGFGFLVEFVSEATGVVVQSNTTAPPTQLNQTECLYNSEPPFFRKKCKPALILLFAKSAPQLENCGWVILCYSFVY